MLAVVETENLYVYIYISSLSSMSPWLSFSPFLLLLLQYHFLSLFWVNVYQIKNWTFNDGLSEISNGLECFGFLNVMKAKSDAFYHVFCPGNIFSWYYDSLVQRLPSNYSEDGSNDTFKELHVYKIFVEFAESSFMVMDGKVIVKGFICLLNY